MTAQLGPCNECKYNFYLNSGKIAGGVEMIDESAGTDELSLRNLSDILLIATAPSGNFILEYSDQSGSITGTITTIKYRSGVRRCCGRNQPTYCSGQISQRRYFYEHRWNIRERYTQPGGRWNIRS